jgi:hypothetical protein
VAVGLPMAAVKVWQLEMAVEIHLGVAGNTQIRTIIRLILLVAAAKAMDMLALAPGILIKIGDNPKTRITIKNPSPNNKLQWEVLLLMLLHSNQDIVLEAPLTSNQLVQ